MTVIDRHETLRDKAYQLLKKYIITGEFEAGKVYTTTQLVKLLKMSRTPIREAIIKLSNEGLINELPNNGFLVPEFSIKMLCELSDVNRCIESFAVSEIIKNNIQYDIEILKSFIKEQREALCGDEIWRFYKLNCKFHQEIIRLTNNEILYNIGQLNIDKVMYAGYKTGSKKNKLMPVLKEHEDIVIELQKMNHDAAVKAINEHYIKAKGRFII